MDPQLVCLDEEVEASHSTDPAGLYFFYSPVLVY